LALAETAEEVLALVAQELVEEQEAVVEVLFQQVLVVLLERVVAVEVR
jgi:hypothetical protein